MDREKREAAARAQAEDLKRERAAEKERQGAEDRQRREKEPERHSDDRWAERAADVRVHLVYLHGDTRGGAWGIASVEKGAPAALR